MKIPVKRECIPLVSERVDTWCNYIPAYVNATIEDAHKLQLIGENWDFCQRCPLGEFAKHHVLWDLPDGVPVDVLFIGEGPGVAEDELGKPFVGPAGKLLRSAIKDAINSSYVLGTRIVPFKFGFANLLACRPFVANPDSYPILKPTQQNRTPMDEEVSECMPRLVETIQVAQPRYLWFLGLVPSTFSRSICKELSPEPQQIHSQHPSHVLRRGEIGSQAYQRYVDDFRNKLGRIK